MKLVKEYINEKFEEDSDPIDDLNIGMSTYFKDVMAIFGKMDTERCIYTIAIVKNHLDFMFYYPNIAKWPNTKRNKIFDYVQNMIDEAGFRKVLTDPEFFKCMYKTAGKIFPRAVRYTIKSQYVHLVKQGEYRRGKSTYNKSTELKSDEFVYYGQIDRNYESDLRQKESDN
jgi:hypothetical protein